MTNLLHDFTALDEQLRDELAELFKRYGYSTLEISFDNRDATLPVRLKIEAIKTPATAVGCIIDLINANNIPSSELFRAFQNHCGWRSNPVIRCEGSGRKITTIDFFPEPPLFDELVAVYEQLETEAKKWKRKD